MKPHDRPHPDTNLRRRTFLLTASLGGAGAVAVAALGPSAAPTPPAAAPAAAEGSGYQLSAHVLHYYRTART